MLKKYLSVVNLILILMFAAYSFLFKSVSVKQGYILNERVFNGFKGKHELETRLKVVKQQHKLWLDSVGSLIQQRKTDDLIKIYEENAENFQIQEQQLTEKYTADIWKLINQYVERFGKERGYEYIFGASGDGSLMYANDANNVTEDVIQYVNARYEDGE